MGCFPELSGSLRIDGTAFVPTDCRTGAWHQVVGVDLVDASGRRIEVSIGPREFTLFHPSAARKGVPTVTLFQPHQSQGYVMASCGSMTVGEQSSKVPARNVEGSADLSCQLGEHSVSGHVEFSNCH